MEKETLKRIFDFLEEKENKLAKVKETLIWKIAFNEPLTKEDLDIEGSLFLHHSNISYLPEGLKIGGNLHLSYTPKLKSLPSDLDVKGDIYLEGSKITSLPEGLKVRGELDLFNSKITSLLEGLKVGGDLLLQYTTIKSLPKGLEVGGDLYIRNTELEGYTDEELRDMIKPGFIKGKIKRG